MIFRKLVIMSLFFLAVALQQLAGQSRSAFTGDLNKYIAELREFMGPNLNFSQSSNLNKFIQRWDSSSFSGTSMVMIVDISSQLSSRPLRPVPNFNEFLVTLNYFVDYKRDDSALASWLKGLSEIAFSPRFSSDNLSRFFSNTGLMLKENVLYESGSVRWKIKNSSLKFEHDTIFHVLVSNATLSCYTRNDSTEIYNVTGIYFPEIQEFRGSKGLVTWEKAGYGPKDVFAEIRNYTIDVAKNGFTADSARFIHKNYFSKPELGQLTDKAMSFRSMDKATFPVFKTYTKEFRINNIFKGVDYEGGLTFEGANIKGTGEKFSPAKITLYRNDTLYLKISSDEFLFSKSGLNSQEVSVSLYLGADSIYHSTLGFSYIADTKQVNLFRTNNPISSSPYFNSFHNLDMYFEYLSWNMNESKIALSRIRGSSLGQAEFKSSSYFNAEDFLRMMGLDDYHPLNRLLKFAEYFYSETFPVDEFAKWMNKPVEAVIALCIDLANKGFIFYDRINNEITIKKKTKDYLDSYARKKDYDVLNIYSETKAPVDNAILNMKDYRITVNGVSSVFLSDSQKVAIHPYNRQLVIGRNRDLFFDGIVEAGLYTIYGHNFLFSYDTFKIDLHNIDSIKIAVESEERDYYGKPIIKKIDNMIQLGTAELLIDDPNNKSGLKSLKQYPIINATTYSYIFYDRIAGLEGVYKKKDFYFKVNPFTYENIDHFTNKDLNLPGEFFGGNILKPMPQNLIIQENNSLGFNMTIPEGGVELYGSRARIFDTINMSNRGLIGSGKLKHLSSTTLSDEYKFFPDSMIAHASTFDIEKDSLGLYPLLDSKEVDIKWLTQKDEWMATNPAGKTFSMFGNGTTLDGKIMLSPGTLRGTGIIDMTNSRITSKLFSFTSNAIKADTADYNLKSPATNGYSFIAEDASTNINFDLKMANFHLNTDSSMVKFPEIQYICTMTDFSYNMETRILNMEQKGKSQTPLLTADKLIRTKYSQLDKPTFFATNSLSDTISFSSWKGVYHLDQEYIEAENINYIHIADALIQPRNGKIIINRRAKIQPLDSALIALNNRHLLHSGNIVIETAGRYSGSAVYDYIDENNEIQRISFPELKVDTLTTSATGYIPVTQHFRLSPAFTFTGDVTLSSRSDLLNFTGAAGVVHKCNDLKSYSIKFKSSIDPKNVMIPVSDKPRDMNDNLVFSGSFISTDSIQIYPAFLSAQKSWSDVAIVNADGWLYFDKPKGRYLITSREKIADPKFPGNMIGFDKNFCILTGEGNLNFGAKLDMVKLSGAGKVIQSIDSGKVSVEAILALNFFFSSDALKMMADEIRMMPSLKPVNLNSDLISTGMKDLMGKDAAEQIKEEMDLFGTSRNMPKNLNYELLLNEVNLYWNEATSSFRSKGKIGIGFIGPRPVNVYVDGYIEIQRRRSGDLIDIYLKADKSTWYYFSYFQGVMMTQAGNNDYNTLISNIKQANRKDPQSTVRTPYSYMIAVENRLERFLSRMTTDNGEAEPPLR